MGESDTKLRKVESLCSISVISDKVSTDWYTPKKEESLAQPVTNSDQAITVLKNFQLELCLPIRKDASYRQHQTLLLILAKKFQQGKASFLRIPTKISRFESHFSNMLL